jgi:hypothetical protein
MPIPLIEELIHLPLVSRIRRNHGLEHATIHLLSARYPQVPLIGRSDGGGFWLLGNVPTQAVKEAIGEALERMRNGEWQLALHAQCGTNLVAAGTLAGLAGASAMTGSGRRLKDKLGRLPLAALLATLAIILAQPLGMLLQKHLTTSSSPEDLEVVEVIPTRRGRVIAHRIITRG